ncbi:MULTISPECIES: DUF6893 family small protein [Antrihabitans]|jgi:hypothetical protein|uniref:DUF6893 family small protein n=1 Tax=Antrihabitans spumae TaxID=3373370 RepID=A0ABW7KJ44_9NOCA
MRVIGEVATIAMAVLLAAGVVVGISSLPDIKRYIRMRQM